MVRSFPVRLNAAHPELPLMEASAIVGSPSTAFISRVPATVGTWTIAKVYAHAEYPAGTITTVEAARSAEGIWTATLPATQTSGRVRCGFTVLADGIDELGEPVTGYTLGIADMAIYTRELKVVPGYNGVAMHYFDAAPAFPKKGDVAPFDGVVKMYDGTQWVAFGSEVDLSDYYTKEETDAAIEAVAAYYITADAQGSAFATYSALVNAETYYSGGVARTLTRNDYAVVLADETHDGAEYRYIYAIADGATQGQWEAQYPIETNDYLQLDNKPSINSVTLSGNKTGADLGLANETTPVETEAEVPASCYPISYSYGAAYVLGPSDIDIQIRQGNIYLSDKTHAMQYLCVFSAETGVFLSASSSLSSTLRFNGTAPVADSWPVLEVTSTGGTVVRSAEFAEALDGKLAKSGGTATDITFAAYNAHTVEVSPAPAATGATPALDFRDPATDYTATLIIGQGGQVQLRTGNTAEGNIPKFDAQRRLVDSGKAVTDFAEVSALRYTLGTTITATATLADRTANVVVAAADNTADILLSFPPTVTGKVRDFVALITNNTGNTGDITFVMPSGATVYGDAFTTPCGSGETWLYSFTEVAPNKFFSKAQQAIDPFAPKNWGLYFEAETDNVVVNMTKTGSPSSVSLETSTDGTTWTTFDGEGGTTPITLTSKGDRVYFRAGSGGNTAFASSANDYHNFSLSGACGAHGNIMSILNNSNENNVTLSANLCFYHLFYGCTNLTTAPLLPATTLTESCYSAMFRGCTALTEAPDLPATTRVPGCYSEIYYHCSSLSRIHIAFTDWGYSGEVNNWVFGVASTGTFICPTALGTNETIDRSVNRCPANWTVVNI